MASITYNPGEPVFDQSTGEPYIDENGALVEVEPGLKVEAPDGRTLDGDDVANAAYYRGNKFRGESLRDASIGVPYLELALGQANQALAASVVVAEIRARTPGVSGVVDVTVLGLDAPTRVLQFTATLIRQTGDDTTTTLTIGG